MKTPHTTAGKKAIEEFDQQSYWKKRGMAIIPMKCSVRYTKVFYYQVIFRNTSKSENNLLSLYNKRSIDTNF